MAWGPPSGLSLRLASLVTHEIPTKPWSLLCPCLPARSPQISQQQHQELVLGGDLCAQGHKWPVIATVPASGSVVQGLGQIQWG